MIDYTTEAGFNAALERARTRESVELRAAMAGNGPKPSNDIGEAMRKQAEEHVRKVLVF